MPGPRWPAAAAPVAAGAGTGAAASATRDRGARRARSREGAAPAGGGWRDGRYSRPRRYPQPRRRRPAPRAARPTAPGRLPRWGHRVAARHGEAVRRQRVPPAPASKRRDGERSPFTPTPAGARRPGVPPVRGWAGSLGAELLRRWRPRREEVRVCGARGRGEAARRCRAPTPELPLPSAAPLATKSRFRSVLAVRGCAWG